MFYIFPFINAIFALFNALQVTNVCFVSFITDAGNKMLMGFNLQ